MEEENYIEIDIETVIQNFLAEEGLLKQKIDDENSNFHFIVEYPKNNALDLIQPKGKKDLIIIGCATEISKEQIPLIQAADLKTRQEFIWDVRFSINKFLLDFELYHPNDVLERFVITDEIFIDGLTKDRLISSIKKVFKAKLHCIWLLGKTFSGNNTVGSDKQNTNVKDNMFI